MVSDVAQSSDLVAVGGPAQKSDLVVIIGWAFGSDHCDQRLGFMAAYFMAAYARWLAFLQGPKAPAFAGGLRTQVSNLPPVTAASSPLQKGG